MRQQPGAYSCVRSLRPLHARRGQALTELAIFGSFLLLVLGSMIGFGLNAEYRQRALMESYRRAEWSAARSSLDNVPSAMGQTVMIDRVVPDPSSPFATGTVSSVSASASAPLRTVHANLSPDLDNARELPHEVATIKSRGQTVTVNCPSARRVPSGGPGCTTTGFRTTNVRGFDSNGKNASGFGEIDRYYQVYGAPNVRPITRNNQPQNLRCAQMGPFGCVDYAMDVQIIDPMEGDIIAEEAAAPICHQLIFSSDCQADCEKSTPPEAVRTTNCIEVCRPPIQFLPWYCDSSLCCNSNSRSCRAPMNYGCTSRQLANVFRNQRTLGLQPNTTQTTITDLQLTKSESPTDGIATSETVQVWNEQIRRPLVTLDAATHRARRQADVISRPKRERSLQPKTVQTPWD